MSMLQQPIESRFAEPCRVLVAGAGGGFDVIAGLGIALGLARTGHTVHLANLSFMPLEAVIGGRWVDDVTLRVDADCTIGESYAPEIWLSEWYRRAGQDVPVYCFKKVGAAPLSAAYSRLAAELALDALVLVDGGVDAFLRGDEFSLGTPTLDQISVAAASSLSLPVKIAASIGFGAERWDRISHAQALRRFAELTAIDGLLGVESLVAASDVGRQWLDAIHHVHSRQGPLMRSIVSGSIEAAMRGRFGELAVNQRTEQTPIWISPLTALCWFFELDAVARQKPYLDALSATETVQAASDVINAYHAAHRTEPESIPI